MEFKMIQSTAIAAGCVVALWMSVTAAVQPATAAQPDSVKAALPAHQLKPQTTCPVSGDPINRKHYVDYNGKRLYLCCADCVSRVKQDPQMYIKKLEGMGQSIEVIGKESSTAALDTAADSMNMKNMVASADTGRTAMHMKKMNAAADTGSVNAKTGYWTCSMHPAVRKAGPGQCPICKMNLVHKKTAPAVKK